MKEELTLPTENVDRFKRLIIEGCGKGDMAVIDEMVAEDFTEHQNGLPQGREKFKGVIQRLRRAFPDLTYKVIQMAQDGETVWGHFRGHATHQGPFMGCEPTGKRWEVDVIDIARFKDGKMVEHWGVPDQLELFKQLGMFPPQPSKAI